MLYLVCPARYPVEGGDEEHREQRRMLYQCTWCILLDIQWRELMRNTEGREGMLYLVYPAGYPVKGGDEEHRGKGGDADRTCHFLLVLTALLLRKQSL